jgi:hypothetical protein
VYVWNGVDFSTLYLTRHWTNEAGIGGSDWSWPLNDALPSNFYEVKAYAKNAAGVIKESENQWGWFQIQAEEYPVTYNANGGNGAPFAQAKYKDVQLTLRSEKPWRTGYSYTNWKASNGATYSPGVNYSANEATTLAAQWTPNTYIIKYNANGGTGTIGDQPVNYDENVTMPSDGAFKRDGHALAGWSRSSGTPNTKNYEKGATYAVSTLASASNFNCADKNGETMTLYAVWEVNTHTITVQNDGNGTANASHEAAMAGTEINLTASPNTGYQFKEWQVINGSVTIANDKFIMPAQAVTVKAIFEPLPIDYYSIKVQNDGHGTAYASLSSAAMGTEITLTAVPASGYKFKEWQVLGGSITITSDKFIMQTQNVTVEAIFEPISYAITVQNDGHGTAGANPSSAAIGTEITLTATPNNGYQFKEWQIISGNISLANANSASITFFMPANTVTVRAVFAELPPSTYTVTYNYSYNGGTSATKSTDTVAEGQAIDLTPTATKAGWGFVGWNTSRDATSAWGKTGGLGMGEEPEPPAPMFMGSSAVTLYAIYVKAIGASFIDYSPPGEISYNVSSMYRIYNNATHANVSAGSISISDYPGWTSRGWATNTAANASVALTDRGSTTISADTAFYALYQRTLTLTFNADGGSNTPVNQTGTQYTSAYAIDSPTSVSFTLPAAISKPGHKFIAWAEGGPDGRQYQPGATITISENTTVYAKWSKQFERFSFANNEPYFAVDPSRYVGYGETPDPASCYYISDEDFLKLVNYVANSYGSEEGAKEVINALQNHRSALSAGSCFGMAAASILDYNAQIDVKRLDPEASTLLGVRSPNENSVTAKAVRSAINYYQFAQGIDLLHEFRLDRYNHFAPPRWDSQLVEEIVAHSRTGEPILFNYLYGDGYGHSIVITGYDLQKSNADAANHILTAYDNRKPDGGIDIKVARDYKTIVVDPNGKNDRVLEIQTWKGDELEVFDLIDFDGPLNKGEIIYSNMQPQNIYTKISVKAGGIVRISNAEGDWLEYDMTKSTEYLTGNIQVFGKYFTTQETVNGDSVSGTITFLVSDSESYCFSGTEGLYAQVVGNGFYATIESSDAGVSAVLDKENGISVEGPGKFSYTAAIGVNNDSMDLVKVSGTAVDDMGLMLYRADGAVISGSANQILDVTVISDLTQTERCSFNSSYDSLLVSKQEGDLGVYGGEGYEVNILKPADKTALRNRISQLQAIDEGNYTTASWNTFQNALGAAKAVVASDNATQVQVDTVLTSLNDAYENLVALIPVQKPVANGSTSVTIDYVGSKQLSVTGEDITWSGSNKYITVDQKTGVITSTKNFIKTGSAQIIASNSAGSVAFNVKVKPTFLQWLMIIFLFGWIWM